LFRWELSPSYNAGDLAIIPIHIPCVEEQTKIANFYLQLTKKLKSWHSKLNKPNSGKRLVAADVYIGFVMKKSRELIALHSSKHKWLQDLERLLNQIDQQTNQCGDTLIECSKSFIEAIAKNIILKLRPYENAKDINLLDLGRLFKKAKECIYEHSAIENVNESDIEKLFFST
jgi:hypothetical protein